MVNREYIRVRPVGELRGELPLEGAKNSVLVLMASLLLARGVSRLKRVPASHDVEQMIALLSHIGARVAYDPITHELEVDASTVSHSSVPPEMMNKMRASVLVMGPLLARFGRVEVAMPGGCLLGARPIDYHLRAFARMGALITVHEQTIAAEAKTLTPTHLILDYPSVGATENILMAAVLTPGVTLIGNAALEPEVLDLIEALRKMGARISLEVPATIKVEGVEVLEPIEHEVIADRLEAGTLLLAVAATGGELILPDALSETMELFLEKLREMGHLVEVGVGGKGIRFVAQSPAERIMRAISFKTMPHPGFPTDLQAPTMAVLCRAQGTSVITETVFDNRLVHVRELSKMGAQITLEGNTATVRGVEKLFGASVIATDIRASAALVIAGLAAEGETQITGVHHLLRGYEGLDKKLRLIGADIEIIRE